MPSSEFESLSWPEACAPQFAHVVTSVQGLLSKFRAAQALLEAYDADGWRGAKCGHSLAAEGLSPLTASRVSLTCCPLC